MTQGGKENQGLGVCVDFSVGCSSALVFSNPSELCKLDCCFMLDVSGPACFSSAIMASEILERRNRNVGDVGWSIQEAKLEPSPLKLNYCFAMS